MAQQMCGHGYNDKMVACTSIDCTYVAPNKSEKLGCNKILQLKCNTVKTLKAFAAKMLLFKC